MFINILSNPSSVILLSIKYRTRIFGGKNLDNWIKIISSIYALFNYSWVKLGNELNSFIRNYGFTFVKLNLRTWIEEHLKNIYKSSSDKLLLDRSKTRGFGTIYRISGNSYLEITFLSREILLPLDPMIPFLIKTYSFFFFPF